MDVTEIQFQFIYVKYNIFHIEYKRSERRTGEWKRIKAGIKYRAIKLPHIPLLSGFSIRKEVCCRLIDHVCC